MRERRGGVFVRSFLMKRGGRRRRVGGGVMGIGWRGMRGRLSRVGGGGSRHGRSGEGIVDGWRRGRRCSRERRRKNIRRGGEEVFELKEGVSIRLENLDKNVNLFSR